ncbi:DctP family TRAP transporter solute-binding subunit [Shinella sp. AETb1-6]|uniref:TRAP transporter substrate-binding protein n=1 Tax=Shinella sumterensis TaxID=1967501 RepID=A0AA50H9V0_9HYPH|nr:MULTISPECIES: TRAP transporter substrate-binding protein [Shinella]MCD1266303.1 DctP family TRAP transporter solute-binding subunit [Shinella sumterensis]MXN53649.1 DctP family TRAP transporter solute-binding subunit [Shinella sp. AETb1-6]WLR99424.1 TRAP transporter substrate-binding protein [Shinella sumterensis]WLS10269.1 TRAP transporter substrate-binding protein [Shinella sumterensis]
MRLAVETTSGDPTNVMLATFRDELKKTTGDAFAIEFFDGGSLGDENALAELIRAGAVEVIPLGSDGVAALDSKFSVFDTPFLFSGKEQARAMLDGELGQIMAKSLKEKANLEVLAFGELGVRVITNSKREIKTPTDLSGLKIRTPNSPTRIMAFQTLGAAPTTLALGEVYMGLKQGVIDGQENPLSVVKEFSLFETQPYISLTNHIYTPITLVMNGTAFDSLSDDLKAKVKAAAKVGVDKTRTLSDDSDANLVAEFEKAGVTVTKPDIAAFQAAAAPVRMKIAEVVTPEFMTQVEETLR